MTIHPSWIGIDISKHNLDIFDGGRSLRIANDAAAIAAFVDSLAGREVRVLFEATGRYDRALGDGLAAAAIAYVRVNPRRARAFAEAAGFLAKTDRVDARMLAAMGEAMPDQPAPADDPDRRRLTDLNKRRDQLVAIRKQERTRLAELTGDLRAGLEDHVAWLDRAIMVVEQKIRDLIAACRQLSHGHDLIRSAPGIGPVAAATLLALMPELGQRSAKTIAALAGLAPYAADSGRHHGKRRIRGGRRRVRDALYMSAVAAARYHPRFRTFYRGLRDAGKPAKVAFIAVARKLLVIINAMMRSQTPFRA
jgi:transposase